MKLITKILIICLMTIISWEGCQAYPEVLLDRSSEITTINWGVMTTDIGKVEFYVLKNPAQCNQYHCEETVSINSSANVIIDAVDFSRSTTFNGEVVSVCEITYRTSSRGEHYITLSVGGIKDCDCGCGWSNHPNGCTPCSYNGGTGSTTYRFMTYSLTSIIGPESKVRGEIGKYSYQQRGFTPTYQKWSTDRNLTTLTERWEGKIVEPTQMYLYVKFVSPFDSNSTITIYEAMTTKIVPRNWTCPKYFDSSAVVAPEWVKYPMDNGRRYLFGENLPTGWLYSMFTAVEYQNKKLIIVPYNITDETDGGYDIEMVDDYGPNRGRWYISNVHFSLSRQSWINPWLYANCSLTLPNPPNVRWHEHMETTPFNMNSDALLDALILHEGYGLNAFIGHMGIMEYRMLYDHDYTESDTDRLYDIYKCLERIVAESRNTVLARAEQKVNKVESNLQREMQKVDDGTYLRDNGGPNWSGTFWIYNPNTTNWDSIERDF